MNGKQVTILVLAVLAVGFGFLYFTKDTGEPAGLGSTNAEASDYQATSTAANGTFTTGRLLRATSGSFGSIVLTGANTGIINVYDATTTDVTKRTGQKATSTIPLLASIPASTVAGTYVFDVQYTTGLYIDITGVAPTTTITFR